MPSSLIDEVVVGAVGGEEGAGVLERSICVSCSSMASTAPANGIIYIYNLAGWTQVTTSLARAQPPPAGRLDAGPGWLAAVS